MYSSCDGSGSSGAQSRALRYELRQEMAERKAAADGIREQIQAERDALVQESEERRKRTLRDRRRLQARREEEAAQRERDSEREQEQVRSQHQSDAEERCASRCGAERVRLVAIGDHRRYQTEQRQCILKAADETERHDRKRALQLLAEEERERVNTLERRARADAFRRQAARWEEHQRRMHDKDEASRSRRTKTGEDRQRRAESDRTLRQHRIHVERRGALLRQRRRERAERLGALSSADRGWEEQVAVIREQQEYDRGRVGAELADAERARLQRVRDRKAARARHAQQREERDQENLSHRMQLDSLRELQEVQEATQRDEERLHIQDKRVQHKRLQAAERRTEAGQEAAAQQRVQDWVAQKDALLRLQAAEEREALQRVLACGAAHARAAAKSRQQSRQEAYQEYCAELAEARQWSEQEEERRAQELQRRKKADWERRRRLRREREAQLQRQQLSNAQRDDAALQERRAQEAAELRERAEAAVELKASLQRGRRVIAKAEAARRAEARREVEAVREEVEEARRRRAAEWHATQLQAAFSKHREIEALQRAAFRRQQEAKGKRVGAGVSEADRLLKEQERELVAEQRAQKKAEAEELFRELIRNRRRYDALEPPPHAREWRPEEGAERASTSSTYPSQHPPRPTSLAATDPWWECATVKSPSPFLITLGPSTTPDATTAASGGGLPSPSPVQQPSVGSITGGGASTPSADGETGGGGSAGGVTAVRAAGERFLRSIDNDLRKLDLRAARLARAEPLVPLGTLPLPRRKRAADLPPPLQQRKPPAHIRAIPARAGQHRTAPPAQREAPGPAAPTTDNAAASVPQPVWATD
eukprot:TRINITY_DN1562_c2_g4_i1.p1 TRINITY_DN1562_c2_g4~~TRINITY_DN1562_c2_g4_i1.p1  ORF type:complete len:857 (+),score=344.19 TRINITY_DN1562_c2_g4_i1:82-2571(+)